MLKTTYVLLLEVNANVNLAGRNAIDSDSSAFESRHSRSHDSKCCVRGHRECWTPTSSGSRCNRGDDDDGTIGLIFGSCVGVVAFWCCFQHCWGSVLESEEGCLCGVSIDRICIWMFRWYLPCYSPRRACTDLQVWCLLLKRGQGGQRMSHKHLIVPTH